MYFPLCHYKNNKHFLFAVIIYIASTLNHYYIAFNRIGICFCRNSNNNGARSSLAVCRIFLLVAGCCCVWVCATHYSAALLLLIAQSTRVGYLVLLCARRRGGIDSMAIRYSLILKALCKVIHKPRTDNLLTTWLTQTKLARVLHLDMHRKK